jgi:L-iditol 2-dehydrogenase
MKACVLYAVGDLRCEETATPQPEPWEALIRVRACGICGSDIPRVFDKGTYLLPTIPGHEFAGEVVAVGSAVTDRAVGERVAVFPLIPCRKCAPCSTGAYAQCENYDFLGSRCDGAFAEYVCAPAWNLLPIPESVSFEEAAMLEPAAVALHALRQGPIDVGDTVLVFGAGPIGLMLGMWARNSGASSVLLADIDQTKLDFANRLGFGDIFNPSTQGSVSDWLHERTPQGADLVIEASGSSAAFEQCMLSARTFGRVVLMGNPAGEMKLSQNGYWAILRKELRVSGTWNSVYCDFPRNEWRLALDGMASGGIDVKPLITHRVGLDGVYGALTMMRDRSEFHNKVMFVDEGEMG